MVTSQATVRLKAPVTSAFVGVRLAFVDNLRTLLMVFLVIGHVAIGYSGLAGAVPGGVEPGLFTTVALLWLVSTAQAFGGPLLFLISGFFTPIAYDKRTPIAFLRDRLVRLGVPLLIYDLLVNPLIVYSAGPAPASPIEFLRHYPAYVTGLGTGPAWYVLNLLLFNLGYVGWRWLGQKGLFPGQAPIAVTHRGVLGLIVGLSIATFGLRLFFPVGWGNFFCLRLPYYAIYLGSYALGIMAWRGGWLTTAIDRLGRRWLVAGSVAALCFPALLFLGPPEDLFGGLSLTALLFAFWEIFTGIGLALGMFYLFRRRFATQGTLARVLSRSAFAVYLIHAPVIRVLNLMLWDVPLMPMPMFILVSTLAVPICFLISYSALQAVPPLRRFL